MIFKSNMCQKGIQKMENIKEKIKKELETIDKMILENETKEKIEKHRQKLDQLLKQYLKDMQIKNSYRRNTILV